VNQNQIEPYLTASKNVREGVAGVVSTQGFKKLTSRRLFQFLYLLRYLEHLHSVLILFEENKYNSAFALRRVLFDTYLRGMWISRCATNEMIESARKNNFNFKKKDFPENRKELQKAVATTAQDSALDRESTMYSRASGFVHSGLYETAMYAIRNNPKVSEHLFRNARRTLRNITIRLLQLSLDFYVQMLRDATTSRPNGVLGIEELMSCTTSLQTIAKQYRLDLARIDGRPTSA